MLQALLTNYRCIIDKGKYICDRKSHYIFTRTDDQPIEDQYLWAVITLCNLMYMYHCDTFVWNKLSSSLLNFRPNFVNVKLSNSTLNKVYPVPCKCAVTSLLVLATTKISDELIENHWIWIDRTLYLIMLDLEQLHWFKTSFRCNDSVSSMLHNLGWQSLHERRQEQRLVLFYKIINGLTSVDTKGILLPADSQTI